MTNPDRLPYIVIYSCGHSMTRALPRHTGAEAQIRAEQQQAALQECPDCQAAELNYRLTWGERL